MRVSTLALDQDVPGIRKLFPAEVKAITLATGIAFAEGPAYQSARDVVVFSDIVASERREWDPRAGVTVVTRHTNKANGLHFDGTGALLVCEHASSCLSRWVGQERTVLASHWDGKELNSPNDVAVGPDGSVWFTDPVYGRTSDRLGIVRERQLNFQGVYRISASTGELELMCADMGQPNGLCFSPDGTTVYVSDTERGQLVALLATAPAGPAPARVLVNGIAPAGPDHYKIDGLICDEAGNIYLTGPGGLWIFDSSGKRLGRLRFPGQLTNVTWCGSDLDKLFVTGRESVYLIQTATRGPSYLRFPGPLTREEGEAWS